MNILLIAYYYPPISSGGSSRPLKIAKYLPRFGHKITVLTHSYQKDDLDNSKALRIYDISHNKDRKGFHFVKWIVLRLNVEILNVFGFYRSIYDFWKNRVIDSADHIISITKPDIIITTYPPVETLELGLFFKNKYNIPLIADFRDGLIFESIEEKRVSKYSCIRKKYESIEQKIAHSASAITTVSPQISEYFEKKYGCNNVYTIPNSYDPEEFVDLPLPTWFDKTKTNIVYTGRFSLAETQRDIFFFFDGVRKLIEDHPQVKDKFSIHLVGQFTVKEKKNLRDLSKKGLVRFHKLVEKRMALSYQKNADLLLLFTSLTRSYMAPGKLYEYLYSKNPILALTSNTFAEDIVKMTNTGWIVNPRDKEKICDFLYRFISIPEFSQSRHVKIDKIKTFAISRQMKNLNDILKLHKL